MSSHELASLCGRLIDNIETVIVGKRGPVELAVATLLAGGHLLIEDIPGVGKTMLARALALSVGGSFKRIQFTPDLLPSDITGVSIYNQGTRQFEYRPGPVFANVVLADEVNRATPKAQAALLEAMEERQVTADGRTYELPVPFFVIATENPIEYEGTYSLPEAQLDRFMARVEIGYPSPADEARVLSRQMIEHPIQRLEPVLTTKEVAEMQRAVRLIMVDPSLRDYMVALVNHTRQIHKVELGASPRGSIALLRLSQAIAAINGRDYVIPDDIKRVAVPALAHRIVLRPDWRFDSRATEQVVQQALNSVAVPLGGRGS